MIIQPNGQDFYAWATAVAQQLGQWGTTVMVDPAAPWWVWAEAIMQLPQVFSQHAPLPKDFDNWPEWAAAFNRSVRY